MASSDQIAEAMRRALAKGDTELARELQKRLKAQYEAEQNQGPSDQEKLESAGEINRRRKAAQRQRRARAKGISDEEQIAAEANPAIQADEAISREPGLIRQTVDNFRQVNDEIRTNRANAVGLGTLKDGLSAVGKTIASAATSGFTPLPAGAEAGPVDFTLANSEKNALDKISALGRGLSMLAAPGSLIPAERRSSRELDTLVDTVMRPSDTVFSPATATGRTIGQNAAEMIRENGNPLRINTDLAFSIGPSVLPDQFVIPNEKVANFVEAAAPLATELAAAGVAAKGVPALGELVKKAATDPESKVGSAVKYGSSFKPREFGDEDFDLRLKDSIIKNINEEAQKVLTHSPKSTRRIYLQIADELKDGTIDASSVQGVLKRNNMDMETFIEVFKASASDSGRTLARFSHTKRNLARAFEKENPELAKKLMDEAKKEQTPLDAMVSAITEADTVRRLAGTSQFKTAVRNSLVTIPSIGVGAMDKALEISIRGGFTKDAFKESMMVAGQMAQASRNLNPSVANKTLESLDEIPPEALGTAKAKLVGRVGIADAEVGGSTVGVRLDAAKKALQKGNKREAAGEALGAAGDASKKALSFFNRAQEKPLRMAAFELRLLQIKGAKSLDEVDLKKLTKSEVEEALDFALEVTFSNDPKSEAGKNALRAFKSLGPLTPIASSVAPYPRFMFYNAPRWMFNHSPLGMLKVAGPTNLKALSDGDTQRTARIMSEALTGTTLMAYGVQNYLNNGGGDKTFEISREDGGQVDMRSFSPLANYYTVFAKYIVDPDSVEPAEVLEVLTSLRDVDQTPLGLLAGVDRLDMESATTALERTTGNYLGMFSVPFRMAKDTVTAFDPEEQVIRDTFQNPLVAPFLSNLPWASQTLPEARKITEGGTLTPDTPPLLSAITGYAVQYRPEIETAIIRAGLKPGRYYPKTGVKEADQYVVKEVGDLAEEYGARLIKSGEFQDAQSKGSRAKLINSYFAGFRAAALSKMAVERPELYRRVELSKRLDDTTLSILHDEGFLENTPFKDRIGLENFLRTGKIQ